MTRSRRLAIASAVVFAVGACAGARLPGVSPEERVQLEILALKSACEALPHGAVVAAEIRAMCSALLDDGLPVETERGVPSEGPVSGDGGPQTWPTETGLPSPKERDMAAHGPAPLAGNKSSIGPHDGQGVRAVQ